MVNSLQPSNLFERLAGQMLPERLKRLIFVASFTTEASAQEVLDPITARSINELLDVCAREGSLELPSRMHRVIWRGRNVTAPVDAVISASTEDVTTDKQSVIGPAVSAIPKQIPKWLAYPQAGADIESILKNHRKILRK